MVGMLEEGGAVPPSAPAQASPAPAATTESPVDEGMEVSEQSLVALDEATEIAYSEKMFPKIVKKFEEGGAEGFPKSMALAVTGTMQKLESGQTEPLPQEVLAEVGVKIFEMLTEDIITSGAVEGVTPQLLTAAVQESIKMWAQLNPDRFDPAIFEQEAMAALQESGDMPPVTPNPEPQNMVPAGAPAPEQAAPPQGGGMLPGGM